MNTKFLKLCFILFFSVIQIKAQVDRPKLVVGIIVDQMRMEYLYRFNEKLGEKGFKRLLNDGFSYENMHYNYVPTHTAPGHASVFTGTTPSNHGIVGNYWYDRSSDKIKYCVSDSSVTSLGNPLKNEESLMSPKNLQTTTITDELRLSTNFKGKVIGISAKDRGAILPAGHFANRAYWLSNNGNFVSSSFYGKDFPKWAERFNKQKKYMKYVNDGWKTLRNIPEYTESLADENPYEGIPSYAKKAVFPYSFKEEYKKNNAAFLKSTPFSNDLLVEFAKEAIIQEQLGKDEITDFLTLSFSSPDYIGHIIGPRSIEMQDTYMRLDESLADFLSFLDEKVGKGEYLLFLTADHACSETPTFMRDHGYDVINLDRKEIEKNLKDHSLKKYNKDFILSFTNQNLYLDEENIINSNLKLKDIENEFVKYLERQYYVKRVYTEEQILNISPVDEYGVMIHKGYDRTQNGHLYILFKAGYMEYRSTGTSHGTVFTYDTNVPAVFYGWKISKGKSFNKEIITKIAPTIAKKIGITLPNSTKSEILNEITD